MPVKGREDAMKYMFLMYGNESGWTDAARKDCMVESLRICDELAAQGKFIATAPLQSVTTAATVRVRDGRLLITDGPFAETHEVLGGFYLILADSREAALAVAAKHPGLRHGAVEVRPLFDLSGLRKSMSIS